MQTDDLLEEASIGTGHFAFGVRSARLATTAMGLGGMFVLQSPSANLFALRDRIGQGLACRGPALFSVFAGSAQPVSQLPPYLTAAAAMQSRAFPAFSYDAAAGEQLGHALLAGEQPAARRRLVGRDAGVRRHRAAARRASAAPSPSPTSCCATRATRRTSRCVPRERWNAAMLPVADWLALDERAAAQRVPYLLAVDGQDALQRVIVDARLMQATRRCLLLWHRLQEHGGVHDSHAERLLAREKAAWAAQQQASRAGADATPATARGAGSGVPSPSPPQRRRRTRATRPGSKPRAAPAATSAS